MIPSHCTTFQNQFSPDPHQGCSGSSDTEVCETSCSHYEMVGGRDSRLDVMDDVQDDCQPFSLVFHIITFKTDKSISLLLCCRVLFLLFLD